MFLWRLSGAAYADTFDGGYGLRFDGRWNSVGHAVTYCASSPALCVLEKLVHIEDPSLMPAFVLVSYDVPETMATSALTLDDLPADWPRREAETQALGDAWHDAVETPLLKVPSAIVPFASSPDANFVVNHRHPAASGISVRSRERFVFDPRLL